MQTTSKRLLCALSLLLTALGAAPAHADGDHIAAVVGREVITDYDLQLQMASARQQATRAGQQLPPPAQLHAELLSQLIDQYALAAYAQDELGISVSDATVDAAAADVAASNKLDLAGLRQQLQHQGVSWDAFRAQLRRQILISRLRQRDSATQVSVSEREVDAYLAQQQQLRAAGAQVALAQIFIPAASDATPDQVKAAAASIGHDLELLRQGRDFAALAQQQNPRGGAPGGVIGARALSQWPALFRDAVQDLRPGQFSGVIHSPAGFHILKVLDRQQAGAMPSSGMQSHVREIVLRARDEAARETAVHELQQVRAAIDAGQVDFAAKASQLSQDVASAGRGGDIGWVSAGELPSALDAALDHLNPGQLSDPIALPGQAVLLQLVDRAERPLNAQQQRAAARSQLVRIKQQRAFDDLVADVRARAYVRIPDAD